MFLSIIIIFLVYAIVSMVTKNFQAAPNLYISIAPSLLYNKEQKKEEPMTEQKDLIQAIQCFWMIHKDWPAEITLKEVLGDNIKATTRNIPPLEIEITDVFEEGYRYVVKGSTEEEAEEYWDLENETLGEICDALKKYRDNNKKS